MAANNTVLSTEGHAKLDDSERTPCEVWTRVMGYHRPASSFNNGKQSEFAERVYFEDTSSSS
jgi:anaerobic ribonucleoside-triphosphate reductase